MADLALSLSGIDVTLCGLSPPLARCFRLRWGRYVTDRAHNPCLAVSVTVTGTLADGVPSEATPPVPEFDGATVRFRTGHGTIEVEGRAARARLSAAPPEAQHFALVNLLSAALAHGLPSCGALLLHAAGVVLDDRAFLLVGSSGSGKTTWASHARSGGARVLSEDLVLVDTSGARVEALGTPIRDDYPVPHGPGRWSVAALLFPVHGPEPRLAPVDPLRAAARVTANLPFVAERLASDARYQPLLDRLTSVPAFDLTFAPSPTFLPLLRSLPASRD